MKRMVMGLTLCLILISVVALMQPSVAAAQDIHHLQRQWPVTPDREDLDCHWRELYPNFDSWVWVVEYIDSDGDESFSIGDVLDTGPDGTYTIFWLAYGLELREVDGDQEWLIVEGVDGVYPPPVNPLGVPMLTIWPEYGLEYVVEEFVDLDGNGFDSYDEIVLNGIRYELIWAEMDVRTIWEEGEEPQPTQESTWSAVKSIYR